MLKIRPIVVDENNIILGGNMRYKACIEAGLKEIYIIQAKDLNEDQKKEFIIKDNVGFGEWDWEILANGVDEVCQANQDIWNNTDSINIVLVNQIQENNQVVNEIAIEVNKEETLLVVDIIEFDDNGLIKRIEAYKG
jgi:hypothetical protein